MHLKTCIPDANRGGQALQVGVPLNGSGTSFDALQAYPSRSLAKGVRVSHTPLHVANKKAALSVGGYAPLKRDANPALRFRSASLVSDLDADAKLGIFQGVSVIAYPWCENERCPDASLTQPRRQRWISCWFFSELLQAVWQLSFLSCHSRSAISWRSGLDRVSEKRFGLYAETNFSEHFAFSRGSISCRQNRSRFRATRFLQ